MATTEFDTSLPSIRQLQELIKDKRMVEWKIVNGDSLKGQAIWQDHNCVCIVNQQNQQITIWKHAIAYYQPQ